MSNYQMDLKQLHNSITDKSIILSFSSLKQFGESPEHFIRYKTERFDATPAMIFGSLIHCLVLEDEEVLEKKFLINATVPSSEQQKGFVSHLVETTLMRYQQAKPEEITHCDEDLIQSSFAMNYKRGKAYELYVALEKYIIGTIHGKTIVSAKDVEQARILKDRLVNVNAVSSAFFNSVVQTELKLNWASYNGWLMTGYVDALTDTEFADIKLMPDANPKKVEREIHNRNTFVQLAIYREGLRAMGKERATAKVIALDRQGDVSVHIISTDYLDYGEHLYKLWLQDFQKCVTRNLWSKNHDFYGRHKGSFQAKKPTWADTLMPVYE